MKWHADSIGIQHSKHAVLPCHMHRSQKAAKQHTEALVSSADKARRVTMLHAPFTEGSETGHADSTGIQH